MSTASPDGKAGSGLRFRAWNLLLLVPLFTLFTVIYNRSDPTLFGMPFFYWFQFVGIFVGVACTSVVYLMTKDDPGASSATDSDEEAAR